MKTLQSWTRSMGFGPGRAALFQRHGLRAVSEWKPLSASPRFKTAAQIMRVAAIGVEHALIEQAVGAQP